MLTIRTIIYFRHGIHWWRYEKFEDTKGVIRSRKSKKERQRNDQKICFKRTTRGTNNDLQSITLKTKGRATRTPLKTEVNSDVPKKLAVRLEDAKAKR
jgi:chaperone required for assembly of F1-ATPase